jgi:ATP-dependent DNA ligase
MMRKKPMLAYPASAKPIDYSKPTFIQPKLDGVRCVIQAKVKRHLLTPDLNEIEVKAYSRTGKEWKNIQHILEQLQSFFDKYPNVILDGELYNHELNNDFEKIISLVRKTKPTISDRIESAEMVQFHCYDIIDEELPFDQRIEFVNESLMLLGNSIYIVDTSSVDDEDHAKRVHELVNLDDGYEGSIVRTNDTYQCKRSHNLRKFKDFSDAEAYIVGYEEGKGKRAGHLGKFIMQDEDGNKFGCPPGKGYNYKDMKYMLENIHEYMGQTATFTYFERTKAGSYRHPLFKAIRDYE